MYRNSIKRRTGRTDVNQRLRLDTVLFERTLWAVSDSNVAWKILHDMMELFVHGRRDLEPTSECYNAVIHALTENGEYAKASKLILSIMKRARSLPSRTALLRTIRGCRESGRIDLANELAAWNDRLTSRTIR